MHNGAEGIEPDAATTWAYFSIYLAMSDGSSTQREWLEKFESEMSSADLLRGEQIVADYRPRATELTLRALAGMRAAEELVLN